MNSDRRTHGFAGQRMVVVPMPVWKKLEQHPLLKGLRVTDAGFFPKASAHFVDRPGGSATELIIVCICGKGRVWIGEDEAVLEAGDVAWLPSRVPHRYEADPADPWTIAWAHFAGSEAAGWKELILGSEKEHVCHVPEDRIGEMALDTIHSALEQGYSLPNLVAAAAAMRGTLSALARLRQHTGATWSAQSRVAASVEKLRANWISLHRLEELAIQAGVSTSHYSDLFRKQTGFSPLDFIMRQRVQHAATLLATTPLPISAVAAAVGYEDPYYFSRCFRKVMGCSPRTYRKDFPGTQRE